MTADETAIQTLNRRTAIAAVRAEAQRIGADPEQLLDSNAFYTTVISLDPDDPDYEPTIRSMVTSGAGPAQPPAPAGPQQWTIAQVEKASAAEVAAAGEAGLLRDLGWYPRRRRRG